MAYSYHIPFTATNRCKELHIHSQHSIHIGSISCKVWGIINCVLKVDLTNHVEFKGFWFFLREGFNKWVNILSLVTTFLVTENNLTVKSKKK